MLRSSYGILEGNLGSVACGNVTVVQFLLLCMKQTSYFLLALMFFVFPSGALVHANIDAVIDADLTDEFIFIVLCW